LGLVKLLVIPWEWPFFFKHQPVAIEHQPVAIEHQPATKVERFHRFTNRQPGAILKK
jgi:hypothetical protein